MVISKKKPNHYITSRIDFGVGSTGHWCVRQPEKLVIFIHGFTGAAESTWHEFPMQFREEAKFSEADVLFLGYNSMRSRALPAARLLLKFIVDLIKNPHQVANRHIYYDTPRTSFSYKKILIVGHSLGGALIRQIAIDLYDTDPNDQLPIKIVLFAPAHKGSNMLNLLRNYFSVGAFFRSIKLFSLIRHPILQDLTKGSDFIKKLEDRTNILIKHKNKGTRLVANLVCFGEYENIVETDDFAQDPLYYTVPGYDHINVCKPTRHYKTPMNYVIQHL